MPVATKIFTVFLFLLHKAVHGHAKKNNKKTP